MVASLIITALLLASCCMGLLVWWKGPEWMDDDQGRETCVHEQRPGRNSFAREVRVPQIPTTSTGLIAFIHAWRSLCGCTHRLQPRHMGDEGSESDQDEEGLLLRDTSTAPAAGFDDDEYCVSSSHHAIHSFYHRLC